MAKPLLDLSLGVMDGSPRNHKLVSNWLLLGVIMIFFQIMLGGITRLTGSGLSITRWEIVTGALPPLNSGEWIESFDLYKQTPQYQKINAGMSLAQYKFIFFWEYIHRLWARLMGFVFALPFIYFLMRKAIPAKLLGRLGIVVLLAGLAAIFGWIMVASGLINRPWVNAYKLTVHLGLGIALFIFMFFTWLSYRGYAKVRIERRILKDILVITIGLVILQVGLGGVLSGMKAAMNYPTWPLMNGNYIPPILLDVNQWNKQNFLFYDQSGFMPALVQFIHRNLAYLISILVIILGIIWGKEVRRKTWIAGGLIGIIVVQVVLGVLILINSIGSIPVFYGVLHQGVGILFLTFLIYIYRIIILKQIN